MRLLSILVVLVPGLALAQIPESALDAIQDAESASAAAIAADATGFIAKGLRSCVGTDDLIIRDQTLKLDKDDTRWAVVATCTGDVILDNVTIQGPRGILITGTGDLVLKKVTIEVVEHGLLATGTSDIVLQDVTLKSKKGIGIEATGTSAVEVIRSKLKAKRPFAFTGTAELAVDGKTRINGKRWKRSRKRK